MRRPGALRLWCSSVGQRCIGKLMALTERIILCCLQSATRLETASRLVSTFAVAMGPAVGMDSDRSRFVLRAVRRRHCKPPEV